MSTPTTTLGAIVALFAGDATLTTDFTAAGGLWVGGVPEVFTVLPFVCLANFHERPDWNFEGQIVEETSTFDFLLYAVGLAAAEKLAGDIKAVFDPSSSPKAGKTAGAFVQLPLATTSTNSWLERQDYTIRAVEYRAADSSWVYEITLPYKAFVARLI